MEGRRGGCSYRSTRAAKILGGIYLALESFSDDDGDAADDALLKGVYILPSNVATMQICSVRLSF